MISINGIKYDTFLGVVQFRRWELDLLTYWNTITKVSLPTFTSFTYWEWDWIKDNSSFIFSTSKLSLKKGNSIVDYYLILFNIKNTHITFLNFNYLLFSLCINILMKPREKQLEINQVQLLKVLYFPKFTCCFCH